MDAPPPPSQPSDASFDLQHDLELAREALCIREADAHNWRRYALNLQAGLPAQRPDDGGPDDDAVRMDWLEARMRACGPDLGYLLGLPHGWTQLRAAIDLARAADRF